MDRLEIDAWRALLSAHAEVVAALEREMEQSVGLPLTWYDVLLRLYEADGRRLRMHELAKSRLLSRSAATRFIDRMESDGLVARQPSEVDGRGVDVVLTADGEAMLRSAAPLHLEGIRRRFAAHLSEEELVVIAEALSRVAEEERRG